MGNKKSLKNLVQKKLFFEKWLFNTCIIFSSLFLFKTGANIALNIKSGLTNHSKKISIAEQFATIFNIGLFSILLKYGLKFRKECPDILLKESSVSKNILNKLCYFGQTPQKSEDLYAPLTTKDIDSLTKRINFSTLSDEQQYCVLQNLICASLYNPLIAKILKSTLLPCTFEVDKNLTTAGEIAHNATTIKKGKILVKDPLDILSVTHELFHAKQIMDGAFLLQNLKPYLTLMNEAEAHALNIILSFKDNERCWHLNLKNIEINWAKKIYKHQIQICQQEYHDKSDFEKKGRAQEKTMGILTKCLIEENKELREKIAQSYCDNTLSIIDLNAMHISVNNWRSLYVKDLYKGYENKLKNNPAMINQELELIPLFDQYYTNETNITQSVTAVKISPQSQSILLNFLGEQKQKIK